MRLPRCWLFLTALSLVACGGGTARPSATMPATATATTAVPSPSATASDGTATPAATVLPTSTPLATATAALIATPAPTGTPVARASLPPDHVFLIIMENHEQGEIIDNRNAPYLNQLAAQYATADHYYAITHPSLPNYLALIGGDTFGITSDCTTCFVTAPNLVDTLEAGGKTWKSYQEDIPRPCFLGAGSGNYAIKHNPFAYFQDVRTNSARCNRVVPLSQLETDLGNGALPNFAWITPNLQHDMHDGSVADGDRWLAGIVPRILGSDAWKENGQLIIVWDEGATDAGCCGVARGGVVPLLFITPNGPRGYHAPTPATHYSLLRTIEDQWGLQPLGHSGDAGVHPLTDLITPAASP